MHLAASFTMVTNYLRGREREERLLEALGDLPGKGSGERRRSRGLWPRYGPAGLGAATGREDWGGGAEEGQRGLSSRPQRAASEARARRRGPHSQPRVGSGDRKVRPSKPAAPTRSQRHSLSPTCPATSFSPLTRDRLPPKAPAPKALGGQWGEGAGLTALPPRTSL